MTINESTGESSAEQDAASEEIYSCLNTIRYADEKKDRAFKKLLSHPTIKKKIEWEAQKFSTRNSELSRNDLIADAIRILYNTILKEWSSSKDKDKAIGWCCSRIGWRIATHVGKEVELERSTDEEGRGVYSRKEKTDLSDPNVTSMESRSLGETKFALMADLIRDANIDPKYKHPLTYVIVMGCNFKELAMYYKCTAPTASSIYKKSLAAFKEYVKENEAESQSIFETITEILDNG